MLVRLTIHPAMKTIQWVGVAVLLGWSTLQTFAIEGLQISVQCRDVYLAWPSIQGKNYIVQYRQTLDPSTPWATLTSAFPADWTTNVTIFVHTNIVQHPNCGGSGGNLMMAMSGESDGAAVLAEAPSVPLAMPVNGQGGAVPLALYPPGIDMSGFIIYDPATDQWLTAAAYSESSAAMNRLQRNGPVPMDGGSGGDNPTPADPPETGFYRVVQDGVQIVDSSILVLTNGVLSNSVVIAFEAGNAANDGTGTNVLGDILCAALIVDGAKFAADGVLDSPAESSPWKFSMDTAYLENGDHTIQVEVTWLNPDNSDGNHVTITRQSDPLTITLSNAIYYPQWEPEIGEAGISAYFVKTTCTNADWQIDIYDVSNKLAQTLTGHTDDGTIAAYWNMVDTNGVTRTNADVDTEFSALVTVGDPITKPAPKKKQRKRNWPDHGSWVISYQDFFKFEYSANNLMKNSINTFAYTAAKYGGYYLYYPSPGNTNDIGQTYPIRYQKTNHFDPSITSDAILGDQALLELFLSVTNTRNFYYNGHGSANTIAGGLPASEVGSYIKHRYRFVFLDGCNTANGKWDAAFGIHGPGRFAITYYQNTGIRPAAFCGYNQETPYATGGPVTVNGVQYDDTIPDDVPYFITNFLFYWDLENYRLQDAISSAQQYLSPVNGWYPGTGLQIYGYDDLRIDEVNHAADTW